MPAHKNGLHFYFTQARGFVKTWKLFSPTKMQARSLSITDLHNLIAILSR